MPVPKSNTESHACPFADRLSKGGDEQHIEGRFSRLEAEVTSLTHGQEALEHTVEEGFKSVFTKIDRISQDFAASLDRKDTLRSSEVVSKLANVIAIVILVAGFLYQNFSGISASVVRSEAAASMGIAKAENALALANARELQYAHDKGESEERSKQIAKSLDTFSLNYATQHKELDEKLQRETAKESEVLKTEIAGLDGRLQAELRGSVKTMDDRIIAIIDTLHQLTQWQLSHSEDAAEFKGRVSGKQLMNEDRIKTLEQIQLDKLHDYNKREMGHE